MTGERPLRIALTSMAPFVGGAEVAAERLALGLQGVGHEVLVILGTRGPVLEQMERVGLRCLTTPMSFTDKWQWPRYVRDRKRLRQLLRNFRPTLIHSNDLPTHQITSDAARGLGIPRVCHHRFTFDGRAIDWFDKFGAERHLFVSRSLMEEFYHKSARFRYAGRAVVHDGLPLPPAPNASARRQARARLGLTLDRVIVLFAGQINEHKGVQDLIRAWASLRAEPTAELVLIGEDLQGGGRYRFAMEKLAESLRCKPRFLGFQHEVGTWMVAADIVTMPSRVEPLGLVTMEAMAFRRPVVGTNIGGIPEMIEDKRTGLLVPPQDPDALASALGRLINEETTRNRFGDEGRKVCETRFSLQTHVRNILREYHNVLHGTVET